MRFIRLEELKPGMRIARPIFSKKGVLLYDRATVLKDIQSIQNIKSFGLIGLFILEPAEPIPPLTDEDREFERFQTMMAFQIKDEMDGARRTKKVSHISQIVDGIIREYGNQKGKISFIQGLRSKDDYIYKHSLNVAILSALITHTMNVSLQDQQEAVTAAVLHDIGKLDVDQSIFEQREVTAEERIRLLHAELGGFDLIGNLYMSNPNMKRICSQAQHLIDVMDNEEELKRMKPVTGAKVLAVADTYDSDTAVRLDQPPLSEVATLRKMLDRPDVYDHKVVEALLHSINVLSPGTSVELNNGDKALVIRINEHDLLRPVVLTFSNNEIIDLSDRITYDDLDVGDIMKTMDNRHVMDNDALKKFGFS
ncbi:MAG: HD domain-containing protein [Lachnospiraceae bacterium]|nr:HD domain-containing protein [Lachnospiraceae bacterium]